MDDDARPSEEPPWTLPTEECPWAFVDCEMTGLDPARDSLLEVAVVRVRGGVVESERCTLLQANADSDAEARALHGIVPAALARAPRFADVAADLAALLHGAVPVFHGADLDVRFLDLAFEAAGVEHRVGPVLDTVRLARRAVCATRYNLRVLCGTLGIAPVRWHRAGEDVRALRGLFARLCAELAPSSAMDLWEVRVGQEGAAVLRRRVAAVLEDALVSGRNVGLVVRTPGQSPRVLRGSVAWFRPPHVGIERTDPTPGFAVLRADRILRFEG